MSDKPVITQAMIDAYDEYTHLTLDRRGFMEKLTKLAGSGAAAAVIAPLIGAREAQAAKVAPDDNRLRGEDVPWPGEMGEMSGYLVRPADASGKLPGVIVIHENRGLNEHIRDVARRMALEGFMAFAPDFLSAVGGTPEDSDKAREMISQLEPTDTVANAMAAAAFLAAIRPARPGPSVSAGVAGWSIRCLPRRLKASRRALRITAGRFRPRRCRASRPRCCCTMPGWMSASTPESKTTARRLKPPARM